LIVAPRATGFQHSQRAIRRLHNKTGGRGFAHEQTTLTIIECPELASQELASTGPVDRKSKTPALKSMLSVEAEA